MKTALIVDDTKNIRLLLSHCLKDEKFNVYCASNAKEALELISNTHFDIAFIDVKMPNMSGTALLEQIINEGYNFNVVIMTAFGTIKNAITTTKLGAIAYLQKPFTANTIRKILNEIFPNYNEEFINENPENETLNISDIKSALSKSPTDPIVYDKFGDLLISQGYIEKGNLFKEFSNKLKILK
ncbi:hypothetical protein UT300005_31890 [Clostridium sp. CTA-5]